MGKIHRILLVEDDDLLRETVRDMLELAGHEVAVARDGHEACALLLRQPPPDLILTDVRMPKMDGFALLAEVRARFHWHEVAVIFMSAKAQQADIRQGMAMGADDYVVKPFVPDDLLRTVALRLERLKQFRSIQVENNHFLLRTMPHELRTPLCGILGGAELMMASADAGQTLSLEEIRDYSGLILRSGEQLLTLVEKFTLMNELKTRGNDAAESRASWESTDWEDRLKSQATRLAAHYGRPNDLTVCLAGNAPKVPGDLLVQVAAALVDNAFKFSLAGAPVCVRTMMGPENTCVVEVADRGPGFPPERLKEIRPFHQFEREQPEQPGLGTGLACVMAFARLVAGELSVAAREDGASGAVFRLRLPKGE